MYTDIVNNCDTSYIIYTWHNIVLIIITIQNNVRKEYIATCRIAKYIIYRP